MDLSRWITSHATFFPDRTALIHGDRRITYRELDALVGVTASGLARLGLRPGERVGYLGYNSPEFLMLLFGCARLGVALMPMNWRLALPELLQMVRDGRPSVIVSDAAHAAPAHELGAAVPGAAVGQIGLDHRPSGGMTFAELTAYPSPADARGGPASPLLLVYTSGTTGVPKGAVISQRAVQFNAFNSVAMHDMTRADVVLGVLPMFHVGGLNNVVTPGLYTGATVVVVPRFSPEATLQAIAKHRVTVTTLVPATMVACSSHPLWKETDLSSLRVVTTGSTPVPEAAIEPFGERGITVIDMYGSTETCPIALYRRRTDPGQGKELRGYPAMFSEVRVLTPSGEECPTGVPGEIAVRGPHIMDGYWHNEDATAETLRDGSFATGDVGVREDDGTIRIVDRLGHLIISGGENIYPAEVELVLIEHPAVAEAAVVGVPDPHWGETPTAVIVARDRPAPDPAELERFLRRRLARYKVPRRYTFVDTLPRNAMGKIQRSQVSELVDSLIDPHSNQPTGRTDADT